MKSFKKILSEVAQPKSAEEKAFKDQHKVELIKHPVAPDSQFTGEIEGKSKKKRVADYEAGADEKAYDQAYLEKGKPFKMPRNIDETIKPYVSHVGNEAEVLDSKERVAKKFTRKVDGPEYMEKARAYLKKHFDKLRVAEEVEQIEEKAVSQAQQKLMAMALSLKRGEMKASDASDAVKDLAKSMSMKDLEDFAKTKHKGLPAKVEKESKKLSFKEMVEKVNGPEEIQENVDEEVEMMKAQLHFIIYAAEEIMEYLDMVDDPEEWYQNKLTAAFHEIKSLHSYAEGEKRMYDMEPVDRDDIMASYYGEETSVEQIDEALKGGMLKLKNGDEVKLSDKDAKLLNKMLGDLSDKNRKEMEKVLMSGKKGFDEIVSFAREAV